MWIRSGDFTTHKHIIPIDRLRTNKDGLFKLMQQGELAGIIEGREEFPDIDFVVKKNYTRRLDGYVKIFFLIFKIKILIFFEPFLFLGF